MKPGYTPHHGMGGIYRHESTRLDPPESEKRYRRSKGDSGKYVKPDRPRAPRIGAYQYWRAGMAASSGLDLDTFMVALEGYIQPDYGY